MLRATNKTLSIFVNRAFVLSALSLAFLSPVQAADDATVKSNDYRAAARLELATAYYTQRQYGAALQEVNQAIKLYPKYLQAYNMLGLVEQELGHVKEANAAFIDALALNSQDGDTHNNYGLYLCQNNRTADAFQHFENAANNPMFNEPEKALFNAGRCARKTADTTKAQQYFTAALKLQPRATAVMFELADMQYQQKNYAVVLDVLDRIEAIEGASPPTLWLALRAEYRQGHTLEVESYGAQLTNKFPDSPEAILFRARSFD